MIDYRLAPKYKYPIPVKDCYISLEYAVNNASVLGIDKSRIAVGRDSAGGSLAASVVEVENLCNLPSTYIETAEFDCLHDDGINYAKRLNDSAVDVELYETKGTMHGFDIAGKSSITAESMEKRIRFLKRIFSM